MLENILAEMIITSAFVMKADDRESQAEWLGRSKQIRQHLISRASSGFIHSGCCCCCCCYG